MTSVRRDDCATVRSYSIFLFLYGDGLSLSPPTSTCLLFLRPNESSVARFPHMKRREEGAMPRQKEDLPWKGETAYLYVSGCLRAAVCVSSYVLWGSAKRFPRNEGDKTNGSRVDQNVGHTMNKKMHKKREEKVKGEGIGDR